MKRGSYVGVLFAAPWILGFLIFLTYPLIASFLYSFTSFSVLRPPRWIGFENYVELAHDDVFLTALKNTVYYAVGAVPLGAVVAIGLAMLLNTRVRGMSFYRTLFFVPTLVPMVALGTLFSWVFNGDYGIAKQMLGLVHLPSPGWMNDPAWTKATLILISVWGCGQAMVIYLAGLQDVPVTLYEAAELDGAKSWAKTRAVTLPMISPVILFNVIMGMIGAIQIFAVPYVMFPGGTPARSTYFFASYLYDSAMTYQRMGYASAMGWFMFLVTALLTAGALKLSERHVHYEGG